jgi:hypothetical protein
LTLHPAPGAATGDEITVLRLGFEDTLRQLEEIRIRLVEQSFYTGAAELVSGMTYNVGKALTPISIKLWHIARVLDTVQLDRMASVVGRIAANRQEFAPATAYLTACVEALRSCHDTIRADLAVIGDQATHIEQVFYDHERFSQTERQIETIERARVVGEAGKLLQYAEAVSLSVAPAVGALPTARGHYVILCQVFGNLRSMPRKPS